MATPNLSSLRGRKKRKEDRSTIANHKQEEGEEERNG